MNLRQSQTTIDKTDSPLYPEDLTNAQAELDKIHNELMGFFSSSPQSDAPGSTQGARENSRRPPSHLASHSGISHDARKVAQLRARGAELVREIVAHRFWTELDPASLPGAWDGLKDHREANPTDAGT